MGVSSLWLTTCCSLTQHAVLCHVPSVPALLQGDLHLRLFGHLRLPVDPAAWQPRLVLEGPDPLPTLEARLESGPELLSRVQAQWLRPYSLRFELPPEYANVTCFKVGRLGRMWVRRSTQAHTHTHT